jgi:tRNA(fMet)-specific endonuclease VapC
MAVFILDTDIISLFEHGHPKVVAAVAAHAQDQICVSTVTIEEQIGGWSALARSAKTHSQREFASLMLLKLVRAWAAFYRVPFPTPAQVRFDSLMKAKLNVKANDLRIAAIALELRATVVTRNRRDFGRVPGLAIEDWSV